MFNLDEINPMVLICGKSRSGKSHFGNRCFDTVFKKKFHKIILVDASAFDNPLFKCNKLDSNDMYGDSKQIEKPEFFENLVEELKEYKIDNPSHKILLYIDDLGFLFQKLKRRDGDFLDKIASKFRHIGTCCILIQDLTQISNFVRKNATHIVFTKTSNNDVKELAYKNYNCGMNKKEFIKLWDDTFRGDNNRYTKLFINNYIDEIKIIK